MARPPKNDSDKRDLTVRVRVTLAEKQQLWQQAKEAGQTPSDYVRVKALGATVLRPVPTPDRAVLLELIAELGKIGSNVNQIARALNSNQHHAIRSESVSDAMTSVEALTAQLLHLLRDGH